MCAPIQGFCVALHVVICFRDNDLTHPFLTPSPPPSFLQLNSQPKYPGKLITGSFVSKGSKLAYDRRVDKVVKVKVGRKSIKVAMTFVRCIESGAWVHTPDPMTSEVLLTF